MARSVADVAAIFAVLVDRPAVDTSARSAKLTFGVPRGYFCDRLETGVQAALERALGLLGAAGHSIRDVTLTHAQWTPDVYLHIVLPEASRYHAHYLDTYAERYSPGVRIRLEMGRYVLAEDYVRAMRLRRILAADVDWVFSTGGCDALVLPTLPIPAPPLGATTVDVNGTQEPIRAAMLRLTQLFNITGHPSLALPAPGANDGLPRSLQVVGPRDATERLIAIAGEVERCTRPDA
jgi:aspartyl-tRNA(Asn)/glutamyl-tRNA(Gln) amidotransferase subunit A